jgi:glutamyl-tRNA synthetase
MSEPVCVRFAPSPTGYLHIGGARTALFNWLFARQKQGRFLLRVEDTDRERSTKAFEQEILEGLKWLGLNWDGEVIHQAERIKIYQAAAQQLIDQKLAYRVDSETLAVKFQMPQKKVVVDDLIRGRIEFDSSALEEMVLIKSDGMATYQFACVVDDHEQAITHVIRGEDHLTNTAKQTLLYEAFGWKAPQFAHLSLILGEDGTPLSKRHGAVSLKAYRESGYLAEGLLNYFALLGWGPTNNQEFFSKEDLVKQFSLKRVNKTGAMFDLEKCRWINALHLKKLSSQKYLQEVSAYVVARGWMKQEDVQTSHSQKLLGLFQGRIKTFSDLEKEADFFFKDEITYDEQAEQKYYSPSTASDLKWVLEALEAHHFDSVESLEALIRKLAGEKNKKAADLIHPLRVAITGHGVSPGLFELMEALGKEKVIQRLRSAIAYLEKK